jgi:hypothetical protein
MACMSLPQTTKGKEGGRVGSGSSSEKKKCVNVCGGYNTPPLGLELCELIRADGFPEKESHLELGNSLPTRTQLIWTHTHTHTPWSGDYGKSWKQVL